MENTNNNLYIDAYKEFEHQFESNVFDAQSSLDTISEENSASINSSICSSSCSESSEIEDEYDDIIEQVSLAYLLRYENMIKAQEKEDVGECKNQYQLALMPMIDFQDI